jgi:uncharacterized membrane protein
MSRHRVPNGGPANVRLAHLEEWLRTGLWFVPGLCVLGAGLLAAGTLTLDRHLHSEPAWLAFGGGATSAELILSTIATSMMTFTGLVFTITVVALQLASSQSPRASCAPSCETAAVRSRSESSQPRSSTR